MSRRLAGLLALGFLVAGARAAAGEDRPADQLFTEGSRLDSERKFEEAARTFTRCLELKPDHAEALGARGSAHFMLGKFAASVADFDRQVRLRPEAANGHWRRGISLYYAGKYDEGKK